MFTSSTWKAAVRSAVPAQNLTEVKHSDFRPRACPAQWLPVPRWFRMCACGLRCPGTAGESSRRSRPRRATRRTTAACGGALCERSGDKAGPSDDTRRGTRRRSRHTYQHEDRPTTPSSNKTFVRIFRSSESVCGGKGVQELRKLYCDIKYEV